MFKRAFECKKCPQRNDAEGCPAWWEWVESNPATGEERLRKDCGWRAMPAFLTEVIKASNRPAAAIESTRNEIAGGFGRLTQALLAGPGLPPVPHVRPEGGPPTHDEATRCAE